MLPPACARSRVFMALVAGCVAGVLGLTGLLGFLCYAVAMALVRAAAVSLRRPRSVERLVTGMATRRRRSHSSRAGSRISPPR